MDNIRIGSLFTGYGGLDMGVQLVVGGHVVWTSDIDAGACKIIAHRYPDLPNLGDITTVDWHAVEPVDVLTGGFPCQDVSHAGRRAGLIRGETRTGLWAQMLTAIDILRPRLVVAENVRGLLSATADSDVEPCPWCMGDDNASPMRALGAVLADLADIGYDAEWVGLRASDVGACHGRFRVFVAAHPAGVRWDGPRATRARWDGPADGDLLPTPTARDGKDHMIRREPHRPNDTDTLSRALTVLLPTPNASVANDGETVETWEARRQRTQERVQNGNGFGTPLSIAVQMLPTPRATRGGSATETVSLLPTPRATDGSKGGPNQRGSAGDLMLPSAVMQQRWGEYEPAIARAESLYGPPPEPTEPGPKGAPRLSPRFAEWMMCLPAGHVTGVPGLSRIQQLKALGNGVVPPQAAAAVSWLLDWQELTA